MNLKKTAASKRASIPYRSDYAKSFSKDWERLSHSGRYDMNNMKVVMMLLIEGKSLGAEWKDHPLNGDWSGYRECHIGGDFLLIYKVDNSQKPGLVVFVRAGTHAELFE